MKTIAITVITVIFASQIFAQSITADTTLANKHFETAKEFYKNKSYDTAIVHFEKASVLYEKHEQWRKYLLSETKYGQCYQKTWKLNQAIAILKPAIEKTLLHISENDTIVADAYHRLGVQYYYQSINDSILFYWEKTLEIRKNIFGEEHASVSSSYNNIGNVYFYKSEYDKALEYHFKSLEIKLELFGEKHTDVAMTYMNIGNVYAVKSEYDKALEYHFKSLEIKKEILGEKHTDVAASYNNIGIVYADKSEYDKALEYYYKSLEIQLKLLGEKHTDVAMTYMNIGNVYANKSEYNKALEYYYKSLEIKKELLGEKHPNVAASYNNIGNVYAEKSAHDKVHPVKRDSLLNRALKYYFKSLKIKKELLGEKNTDVAMTYNNIGNVYEDKSEYDKVHPVKRDSLLNKALEYYFKSLEISLELLGEKHTDVAQSYNNIGNVYLYKSEYDKALKYYQKGVANCLRNFNDTINVSAVPEIKDYLDWNYLLQALQAKAQIFADTTKDLTAFKNLSGLSRQELALLHYQASDTLITKVRKEITTKTDKLALGEKASEIYKGAVNVCLNLSVSASPDSVSFYNEQAFYFSEKNKSSVLLESLAGAEALKFAGLPDTLLNLEHKLSIDIVNYINLKNNAKNDSLRNVWSDRLFKANRSYDSLIVVFETLYPEYYNLKYNNSAASVKQISNLLNKKTAMLSYFVGDSLITIFALTKMKFAVKQLALPDYFSKKIENYRLFISNTNILLKEIKNKTHYNVLKYNKLANEFYSLLFPDEIKELLSKEIENLIIIPDGQLAIIPFETLHTQKYNGIWTDWKNTDYFSKMPYLIKDYNISYSYSATLFQQITPKQKTDKVEITPLNDWIGFAPVFDDKNTAGTTVQTRELLSSASDSIKTRSFLSDGRYVAPLLGTESEVKTIFNLYDNQNKKAVIKTHLQANESSVKSKELQNYKIIHFATHGFVNEENPKLSGILFAQDTTANLLGLKSQNEGILYQSEIYNLKFNADLVVLSACETGLGKITKGEGVIGLTRALLYARSKNIIVSLWQVSDASTKYLIIDFYKNLLESEKQDKFAKHLSKAKRQMIKSGKYAHPFFWSPFILIGE